MQKILVSSCLLGHSVRYDGTERTSLHASLKQWFDEGRIVAICPEVAAGFSIPRPPAEIRSVAGGNDFWAGETHVLEIGGRDVSQMYRTAGELTLSLAMQHKCKFAILTDGSPSCGSTYVYDGSFQGIRIPGKGTTAALLEENGIKVFSETEIDELAAVLDQ